MSSSTTPPFQLNGYGGIGIRLMSFKIRPFSNGYQINQFILIDKCPYHEVDLMEECPDCSMQIPFLLSDVHLSKPFTYKCGFSLSRGIVGTISNDS